MATKWRQQPMHEAPAMTAADARAVFDGMAAWLDETRAMFDVPGIAVAIVKGGEIVATFASGQRDVRARLSTASTQ